MKTFLAALALFGVLAGSATVVVVATPGVAQAATVSAARYHWWGYGNPLTVGYANWNANLYYPFLHVSVTPGSDLAWNQCAVLGFDWKRSGHYDGRAARSCLYGWHRSSGDQGEPSGMGLYGSQKFGGCTGQGGYESSGFCVDAGYGDHEAPISSMTLAHTQTAYCVKQWSLWSDGNTEYVPAGSPTACYS